jgi:hypothetical protein
VSERPQCDEREMARAVGPATERVDDLPRRSLTARCRSRTAYGATTQFLLTRQPSRHTRAASQHTQTDEGRRTREQLCAYLSSHPSVHQPIHLSTHPPFLPPSKCLPLHVLIHPPTHPSIHPIIDPSVCLSVCMSIYLSIYLYIYLSIDLSVFLSFYPSI